MAPTAVQYDLAAFVASGGKVNVTQLQDTIASDAAITIALDANEGINVNAPDVGKCNIWFVDPLPVPDKVALDAIVATHQGVGIVATMPGTTPVFPQTVTEDLTWQDLGRIITTPTFFVDNDPALLNQLFARLIGQYRTNGGGEIKIVEEVEGLPNVDILAPQALPDTAGAWGVPLKFDSGAPREGLRNSYVVMGRRNGSGNWDIRGASLSMIKVLVVLPP